jgi:hypothetical protein
MLALKRLHPCKYLDVQWMYAHLLMCLALCCRLYIRCCPFRQRRPSCRPVRPRWRPSTSRSRRPLSSPPHTVIAVMVLLLPVLTSMSRMLPFPVFVEDEAPPPPRARRRRHRGGRGGERGHDPPPTNVPSNTSSLCCCPLLPPPPNCLHQPLDLVRLSFPTIC